MEANEIVEVKIKDEPEDQRVHVEDESSEPEEDRRQYESAADDDGPDDESDDEDNDAHVSDREDRDTSSSAIIAKNAIERAERAEKVALNVQAQLEQKNRNEFLNRYGTLKNQLKDCDNTIARSIAEANGDDASRAIQMRDDIRNEIARMDYEWRQYEESEKQNQQHTVVKQEVLKQINVWKKGFGFDSYDAASQQRIMDIEDEYANTCPYPQTDRRYWNGFTRHLKQIAHEAKATEMKASNRNQAKKVPTKTIYISRERKEALIQAGVWDDPVLRTKYVKKYQEWDRENAQR